MGFIKAYCKERGNGVDPEGWFDFYTSKGWKIGKNAMKDWKAAVRTWERREVKNTPMGKFHQQISSWQEAKNLIK